MQYRIVTPDLSVHDDRTCGGPPHCKVGSDRKLWNAAYPTWRTVSTELEAARQIRQRWPDAFPMPVPTKFKDEGDGIMMVLFENEDYVRRMNLLKQRQNPVCIVELVPETRDDRKIIKHRKGAFDRNLWFAGWVPDLEAISFERQLEMRSSLRIGPTTLAMQVGHRDGALHLQIPGTLDITLTDEFVEMLGKLRGHGKSEGNQESSRAQAVEASQG